MDLCWKDKHLKHTTSVCVGFPGGSECKESACNAWDPASIPRWGRCPGGGNGYPLQYSCLGNPMDRGVWQAIQSMSQGVGRDYCFHVFCLCNSRRHVLQTCEWAESWVSFYSQSWKPVIKYFTTKTHRPGADTERGSPWSQVTHLSKHWPFPLSTSLFSLDPNLSRLRF